MDEHDLEQQDLRRRAAVEQERACGVFSNEISPRLSPEACARIRNVRVGSIAAASLEAKFPHLLVSVDLSTFLSTLAPDRPEDMTATYELELQDYGAYEFDIVASEYILIPVDRGTFLKWLENLAVLVERELNRRRLRKWNYHVPREQQTVILRERLQKCIARWQDLQLQQGSRTESEIKSGSHAAFQAAEPEKEKRFTFSDKETNNTIAAEIAKLQSRILDANAECTITDLDTFIVDTLVESLNIHAEAYLKHVSEKSMVNSYVEYVRHVARILFSNAETRGHLCDPYSEQRMREMAGTTGSLILKRPKLTSDEYEQELVRLTAKCRDSTRVAATKWHLWKNQIVTRILSRLESRVLHWGSEALSQSWKQEAQSSNVTANGVSPSPVVKMKKVARSDWGQLFNLTGWRELKVEFLSDERIQIINGEQLATLNYGEMGFVDKRTKNPNVPWLTLKSLAEGDGVLSRPLGNAKNWQSVEKAIQSIRKSFRDSFGLDEDPITFVPGHGYVAQFRIRCAACYRS